MAPGASRRIDLGYARHGRATSRIPAPPAPRNFREAVIRYYLDTFGRKPTPAELRKHMESYEVDKRQYIANERYLRWRSSTKRQRIPLSFIIHSFRRLEAVTFRGELGTSLTYAKIRCSSRGLTGNNYDSCVSQTFRRLYSGR